ncbi:MAG: DUF1697 domain-containing protein [Eubacteriales bacterium]|nr:DUF1697 domain-containing protein [Eubacteriales bacterium]
MASCLALLRGVNVGSANRIRMEDLRRLFEQAGCSRVETYIQSGNVLFDTPLEESELAPKLEDLLKSGAAIQTSVILRSAEELRLAVSRLPFSADEIAAACARNLEGETLYLLFAAKPPNPETLEKACGPTGTEDRFRVVGRDAYLLLSQSIRNSKLAVRLQDALSPVTARNWNTTLQLLERMNAR